MTTIADHNVRIRNVVEVNPTPGAQWYLTRRLTPQARILRLVELGSHVVTATLECPGAMHCTAHLPDRVAFQTDGHETEVSERLVSGLLPARLLVIHRAPRQERIAALAKRAAPDIVWASEAQFATPFASTTEREPLLPYATSFDARGSAVVPGDFLANSIGAEALDQALVALDASLRRRAELREAVYDVDELMLCGGFYAVERERDYCWAWTGPTANACFIVPTVAAGRVRLTLFFLAGKLPLDANNIGVCVNGVPVSVQHFPDDMKIETETILSGAGGCATVELRQDRTLFTDSRRLGFALQRVRVESVA
jgi:hypothetical protein